MRGGTHRRGSRLGSRSRFLSALILGLAACGLEADESIGAVVVQETPEATVVRSDRWPPAAIEVDPAFRHLGARTVSLGSGKAEIHVLADVSDGAVQRFYWIQFEGQPPGRRYDYSNLPYRDTIGGYMFSTDVRHGAYTEAEVTNEADTRTVGEILSDAGYDFPAPMMRARMVTVDDSGRNELLVIYMEALSASGATEQELAADETRWAAAAAALRERAAAGLDVRRE